VTTVLSPSPKQKFFDNNGNPLVNGKLFVYTAGTSTKATTYTSSTGLSLNTNPIILDYRGECNLWLQPNVAYKYVLAPSTDSDPPTNPIFTVDQIVSSQLVTLYGGVDTGSANSYALNFASNFTSYTDGIVIYWIPSNSNTGPSTINVNGLGAVPIVNQDGTPLYINQLLANQVTTIIYKGTGFLLVSSNTLPLLNTKNTNYTFALNDANNIVLHTDASLYTYTIPTNASVAFAIGSSIDIICDGDGAVTLAPDVGVTFFPFAQETSGSTSVDGHCCTRITKVATNTWVQFTQSSGGSASGSFTGVLSGMTTVTSGTINYSRIGNFVALKISGGGSITGTSNTTSMTLSSLPTVCRPKTTIDVFCAGVFDNGVGVSSLTRISTAGGVTFATSVTGGAFTAAGTKGLGSTWTLMYPTL
jgi:hypothetical protein